MPFSYKPLWKTLLDMDVTKTQMRESLGISPATLAKLGKNENVSLEVIDKICSNYEIQTNDVLEWKAEL